MLNQKDTAQLEAFSFLFTHMMRFPDFMSKNFFAKFKVTSSLGTELHNIS